jgi:hypothetical protein
VPTSVLLAVLAAAGLLALAPALVRRYDATERLVAERAMSTARVLVRCGTPADGESRRRLRTVPGRRPVNPPRMEFMAAAAGAAAAARARLIAAAQQAAAVAGSKSDTGSAATAPVASGSAPVSGVPVSGVPVSGVPVSGAGRRGAGRGPGRAARRDRRLRRRRARLYRRHPAAVYRRRRVFAALVLLNVVELVGLICLGLRFWVGPAVSLVILVLYTVHLRNRALVERRRRRMEARLAARLADEQRARERRAAARRDALRRAAVARAAAQREQQRLSQRYVDVQARRPVRGRPYSQRAAGF